MNINATNRILCFGDSNTWGRSGADETRYTPSVRWTGILQSHLGENYEILEEGIRSRTTDLDDSDPNFPGRNGATYLRPCLESHYPLDIVIIWLGTNDLKAKFKRSAEDVAQGIEKLIAIVEEVAKFQKYQTPHILLVSPPLIGEDTLRPNLTFAGAQEKSQQLASVLESLAVRYGCSFIDLAQHVQAGEFDGVHLEPEMHSIVAEEFLKIIKSVAHF